MQAILIGSTSLRYTSAGGAVKHWISVTGKFFDDEDWANYKYITRNIFSSTDSIPLDAIEELDDDRYGFVADGSVYTWKVRSSLIADADPSKADDWSDWSSERAFIVYDDDEMFVDAPTLVGPADGSSTISTKPTFSWTAVEGAKTYRLVLHRGAPYNSQFWECVTTDTSCSDLTKVTALVDSLVAGETYYWYVSAHASANPGADDPDGVYWVRSLENWLLTITQPITPIVTGGGNGGGSQVLPLNTVAASAPSPLPLGNGVAASTADGEVLNVEDETDGSDAGNDKKQASSEDDNKTDNESEKEKSERAFLLLGWWWIVVIGVAGGAYLYFRPRTKE